MFVSADMNSLIHKISQRKYFWLKYLLTLQTGPKGVINDWREFKRLETERRAEQEKEKQALAKKLTMTCRSHVSHFIFSHVTFTDTSYIVFFLSVILILKIIQRGIVKNGFKNSEKWIQKTCLVIRCFFKE